VKLVPQICDFLRNLYIFAVICNNKCHDSHNMAEVIENSVPAVSESNDVIAADTASSDHPPATTAVPPTAPHSLSTHLSTRLDRTTVCLPIVHGSVAFYLGKKAENKNEFQSHQWTLYLRGPNNEDLSHCIEKVVFQLHPSFSQPIREYTQPPYEVTEKGWGEFDAQIRIHWKDPSEAMTMVCCVFALSLLLWSDTTKKPMYSLD
jgi:YEATS family